MSKDYMEMLLGVVDEVSQDEIEFAKAKMQSQKIANSFEKTTFAVILTALYLSVLAVIDTVEVTKNISNKHLN